MNTYNLLLPCFLSALGGASIFYLVFFAFKESLFKLEDSKHSRVAEKEGIFVNEYLLLLEKIWRESSFILQKNRRFASVCSKFFSEDSQAEFFGISLSIDPHDESPKLFIYPNYWSLRFYKTVYKLTSHSLAGVEPESLPIDLLDNISIHQICSGDLCVEGIVGKFCLFEAFKRGHFPSRETRIKFKVFKEWLSGEFRDAKLLNFSSTVPNKYSEKRDISAQALHDLRLSLGNVRLIMDLFNQYFLNHNGKRLLKQFYININSIDEQLSILENDSGHLMVSQFELREVVRSTVDSFASIASSKGISFRFTSIFEPIYIRNNLVLLRRVIRNLISNSIKYSFKGEIHISIAVQDGVAAILIKDSGIGLPDEMVIFLNNGGDRVPSSRCGLASVVDCVARMRIKILASSKIGEGSEVTIYIPTTDKPKLKVPLNPLVIALLDDDIDTQKTLTKTLQASGFSVNSFCDEEALRNFLNYQKTDIIILDRQVGCKDLYQTIILGSDLVNNYPIIMLSGDAHGILKEPKGSFYFLSKPFNIEHLIQLIYEAHQNFQSMYQVVN